MDKQTKGAWLIHHGRKVAGDQRGAAEYSAIDAAAKAASLLVRLAESEQADLSRRTVEALAKVGGLNPKTELKACLDQLAARRLVDVALDGSVSVVGVNGRTALAHASDLFDDNEPQPIEQAAIGLAEAASIAPIRMKPAAEFIGDTYKLTKADTADFLVQAAGIGFVDGEGDGDDRLLFNGNLFRRENAAKTKRVLDSLSVTEQEHVREFEQMLHACGAVSVPRARKVLGDTLFSKLQAAAVLDVNVVSNEAGDNPYVTAPGAFHKFTSPMVDDAFDHAKALVTALTYGIMESPASRGRIWGVELLLNALLKGRWVGPAPAIENDYRALEFERVVEIKTHKGQHYMRLLKMEIGQIALEVFKGGNASATALQVLPSAGMRTYTPPETTRAELRKRQRPESKAQTRTLLSAVRSGSLL